MHLGKGGFSSFDAFDGDDPKYKGTLIVIYKYNKYLV